MRCHSVAVLAVLVAAAAAAPADAVVTASNITAPADGTYYLVTDADPAHDVPVTGTSNGTTGDKLDLRCYTRADDWSNSTTDVPVAADGSFSTTMGTDNPYGHCVLRAVPANYPSTSDASAFTGPKLLGEQNISYKQSGGPNDGAVYNFYVQFQYANAEADYVSAFEGGLWDGRLQYDDTHASGYLWYENGALEGDEDLAANDRSSLQVDGRNAYGPYSAWSLFPNNSGLPVMTYDAGRDATTGNSTIHETDPIVVCPNETPFPPTPTSCPQFNSAGVQLERTTTTDDGGLQVHQVDTWRSTDNQAHTLSPHYIQYGSGQKTSGGTVDVGLKLPWIDDFATFSSDTTFPGPGPGPGTVFLKANNAAPDNDEAYPVGAISFEVAPTDVRRSDNQRFFLRDDNITVPAGGSVVVRMDYVFGRTLAEVQGKAAASVDRFAAPTVAISSPANGSTVTGATATKQVTVTGSATDNGGLAALTLNGAAVTAAADGTVSAPATLKLGANTLTLVATDHAGNTTTATATATYADNVAPALTGFKAKPSTFRRKRGTTFKLKLSEDAAVTITIARRHGKKLVKRKTVRKNLKAGKRSMKFKSKLAPGRYVATAVAADTAGNKSKKKTARLRVRR